MCIHEWLCACLCETKWSQGASWFLVWLGRHGQSTKMSKWCLWPLPRKWGQSAEVTKFKVGIFRAVLITINKFVVLRSAPKRHMSGKIDFYRSILKYGKMPKLHKMTIYRLGYNIWWCSLKYYLRFLRGRLDLILASISDLRLKVKSWPKIWTRRKMPYKCSWVHTC